MSLAEQVFRWFDLNHTIKKCMARGLVNRSALARHIARDLGVDLPSKFDAIHMAVRRFEDQLEPSGHDQATRVVNASRLEIRTGMGVAIGKGHINQLFQHAKNAEDLNHEFHMLKEPGIWTVVTSMTMLEHLRPMAFRVHEDLVELVVKSPDQIESTPGVLQELVGRVTDANINIVEFFSCWTDTVFLIHKDDLPRALEVLEF